MLTYLLSHREAIPDFKSAQRAPLCSGIFSHPESICPSAGKLARLKRRAAGISHTSPLLKGSWRGDEVRERDLTV